MDSRASALQNNANLYGELTLDNWMRNRAEHHLTQRNSQHAHRRIAIRQSGTYYVLSRRITGAHRGVTSSQWLIARNINEIRSTNVLIIVVPVPGPNSLNGVRCGF